MDGRRLQPGPPRQDPWCLLVSWCDSGDKVRRLCPLRSVSSRWDLKPGEVLCQPMWGGAHPSLFQTWSRLWGKFSRSLTDQRGHLGTGSELMRPPMTFICFKEVYPAMTPDISELSHLLRVPSEERANYKKVIPKKTSGRDRRRKNRKMPLLSPGVWSTQR